ncbi:helix-turn-helix domain-containing protein [Kitasatospora sp. NPDC017646]|uniref:helix-turn-helix domain-containing protein n=1 Tax=Kitasatospora sp. NPDC017646 TaxID=3364024 RepID=UPI00378F4603
MAEHQQEPPAARRPPTAAESFAGELRTLRLDAGQPSFRTMARTVGSISHTTLYEAASGSRLPSWPTTRAFVRACGGDEQEWQRRWRAAVNGEAPAPPVIPAPPAAAPVPQPAPPRPAPLPPASPPPAPPVAPTRPRRTDRRLLWTHALSLLLGLVLGVLGTLGLLAVRAPATAGPDARGCPTVAPETPDAAAPGERPTPDPAGPGASPPSWVARSASGQREASSTEFTLPVLAPVTRGDALVVSMLLTDTCSGPVKVTDSRGDRFQLLGDVTDSRRHRVVLLAAFGASALTTADSIRAGYPRAGEYQVAVDEFRGVSALRAFSPASGEAGGTAFTTVNTTTTCAPGDLLVGTVGSTGGTAPEFGTGWTPLPVLQLSSYRLTTAHRLATDSDTAHCTATGRTTAQWGAVLAVLH